MCARSTYSDDAATLASFLAPGELNGKNNLFRRVVSYVKNTWFEGPFGCCCLHVCLALPSSDSLDLCSVSEQKPEVTPAVFFQCFSALFLTHGLGFFFFFTPLLPTIESPAKKTRAVAKFSVTATAKTAPAE